MDILKNNDGHNKPTKNKYKEALGPINPPSNGYLLILAATEYFTKWVEAIPLKKAIGAAVANFFRDHIIIRFRIPQKIDQ